MWISYKILLLYITNKHLLVLYSIKKGVDNIKKMLFLENKDITPSHLTSNIFFCSEKLYTLN